MVHEQAHDEIEPHDDTKKSSELRAISRECKRETHRIDHVST